MFLALSSLLQIDTLTACATVGQRDIVCVSCASHVLQSVPIPTQSSLGLGRPAHKQAQTQRGSCWACMSFAA